MTGGKEMNFKEHLNCMRCKRATHCEVLVNVNAGLKKIVFSPIGEHTSMKKRRANEVLFALALACASFEEVEKWK